MEGFLPPPPEIHLPFQSAVYTTIHGTYRLRYLGPDRAFAPQWTTTGFHTLTSLYFDKSGSRWSSRGWTVQENVSSNRLLFFGNLNVHFGCPHGYESHGSRAYNDEEGFGSNFSLAHVISNDGNCEKLYALRRYLVEMASDCKGGFTNSTNILPAISGPARVFSEALGVTEQDYAAGFWKNDLFRSLLWSRRITETPENRDINERLRNIVNRPYNAPSWSWVSSDGSVKFDLGEKTHRIHDFRPESDIQVVTTPKHSDAMGEIRDGCIYLTGKIHQLPSLSEIEGDYIHFLPPFIDDWEFELSATGGYLAQYHLDCVPDTGEERTEVLYMILVGSAVLSPPSLFSQTGDLMDL